MKRSSLLLLSATVLALGGCSNDWGHHHATAHAGRHGPHPDAAPNPALAAAPRQQLAPPQASPQFPPPIPQQAAPQYAQQAAPSAPGVPVNAMELPNQANPAAAPQAMNAPPAQGDMAAPMIVYTSIPTPPQSSDLQAAPAPQPQVIVLQTPSDPQPVVEYIPEYEQTILIIGSGRNDFREDRHDDRQFQITTGPVIVGVHPNTSAAAAVVSTPHAPPLVTTVLASPKVSGPAWVGPPGKTFAADPLFAPDPRMIFHRH